VSSYSGEQKHDWYWTPKSRRVQRCGSDAGTSPSDKDDESAPKDDGKELDP
jgi:hypothetical protein